MKKYERTGVYNEKEANDRDERIARVNAVASLAEKIAISIASTSFDLGSTNNQMGRINAIKSISFELAEQLLFERENRMNIAAPWR